MRCGLVEAPSLTHLLFVNDSIVFGETINNEANVIKLIVEEYESCYDRRVNLNKSLIYFSSNIQPHIHDCITQIVGDRNTSNLEKYLGSLQ